MGAPRQPRQSRQSGKGDLRKLAARGAEPCRQRGSQVQKAWFVQAWSVQKPEWQGGWGGGKGQERGRDR